MKISFARFERCRTWSLYGDRVKAAGILALCAFMSACAGLVSNATGGSPGTSGPAPVSLSANSLTFGNQTVGTSSASKAVTLTNTGTSSVNIGISITGSYTQVNTCSMALAAGSSCTVNATFAPTAPGAQTGNLMINDGSSGGPQSVALTGTGISGGDQPSVSLSSTSLTFGDETVGVKSGAKTVTLTNTGGATLNITNITASGDFAETNTCGTSVISGGNCSINATFTPTIAGTRTGSVSITDNAGASPQSVSLTGTGTSGGGGGGGTPGTGCTGAPQSQVQTNVTSQLSYANTAAGVQVDQITDNATNRFYYFDVPAYSATVNEILYVDYSSGNVIVTANTDGTGAQQISPGNTGSQAFFSGDGKLAYYAKPVNDGVPGGEDIYGILVNNAGACQEMRLSNLDVPPMAPLPVWEISSSSVDAAGGQDIAFSPDTLVHRVHVQTDGTSVALPTITLSDPENNATFHRLRLNPKFPNIAMYKRNSTAGTTASPEVWLVDLNNCPSGTCPAGSSINVIANVTVPPGHIPSGGHIAWSPDGLTIAFSEPDIADYWLARNVVNSDGTINNGFTLQEIGPYGQPAMTADYCAFPPGWPTQTLMACLAGPASAVNPKTMYLMSSDGNGTTKLLTATDAQVLTINGTPMPQYGQDNTHLMFNSDRTGITQVYVTSGFTASVP
jgi:hypothetical protein